MKPYQYSPSATITLVTALAVAITGTHLVIQSTGIVPPNFSGFIAVLVAFSFGSAIITATYVAVYCGIVEKVRNPFVNHRSLLAEIAMIECFGVLFYNANSLSQGTLYATCGILNVWTTWLAFGIAADGLEIERSDFVKARSSACLAVAIFTMLGWPVRNYWSFPELVHATAVWQGLVHLVGLLALAGWLTLSKRHRLDPKSIQNSFRRRIKSQDKPISEWTSSVVVAAVQLTMCGTVMALMRASSENHSTQKIFIVPILFLPALVVIWSKLDQLGTNLSSLAALTRMTGKSAQKMMAMRGQNNILWAASIGVRTSTYTIDHDPDKLIGNKIPAMLLAVRNEEILGYIFKLTQKSSLSIESNLQRITGSIDPEQSSRPVVEALNLCAAIYLDADHLAERRLRVLISLLPIINPGLASVTKMDQMMRFLKNVTGFYHCDFTWVDQSIVATADSSRHAISRTPLSPSAVIELLNLMRKSHSTGSFVWISKEAHHCLLREAPSLIPIMEPHTIKVNQEEDLLIFSAKFELLIPRLQLHFSLDSARAVLVDLDLRPQTQHLISIYELEIQNASTLDTMQKISQSISEYAWRGFKEKDHALTLLLKIYNSAQSMLQTDTLSATAVAALTNSLRSSIMRVGYPSQLINQAHQSKLELRDLSAIAENCLSAKSVYFLQSWVFLASVDFSNYSDAQKRQVSEIISSALHNNKILSDKIIQAKIINCAVALIKASDSQTLPSLSELLMRSIEALILARASSDTMSLVLDSLTFLASQSTGAIPLNPNIMTYFDSTVRQSGSNADPWDVAVWRRWQEYRFKYLQNKKTSLLVS